MTGTNAGEFSCTGELPWGALREPKVRDHTQKSELRTALGIEKMPVWKRDIGNEAQSQ